MSNTLGSSSRFYRIVQEHPDLAEFAHALYQLMVPHADDFGRLLIDAETAKLRYYPTSQRTLDDFARVLDILCLDVSAESPAPPIDQQKTIRHLFLRYAGQAGIIGQIVNFEQHQAGLHKRTRSQFPTPPGWDASVPGVSGNIPEAPGGSEEFLLKGREEKRTEEKGSTDQGTGRALSRRQRAEDLVGLYRLICCAAIDDVIDGVTLKTPALADVTTISPRRIAHANARVGERPLAGVAGCWREVFLRARRSPFLCGLVPPAPGRDKSFRADFDWLTKNADHAIQILEGKYDDRRSVTRPTTPSSPTPAGARQGARERHAQQGGQRPRLV